jgi:hypothetical protein
MHPNRDCEQNEEECDYAKVKLKLLNWLVLHFSSKTLFAVLLIKKKLTLINGIKLDAFGTLERLRLLRHFSIYTF